MRLVAAVVRDFNAKRDEEGLTFARKAMILTGMAFKTNGVWEEGQFTPELQNIIQKHRSHFEGEIFMAGQKNLLGWSCPRKKKRRTHPVRSKGLSYILR